MSRSRSNFNRLVTGLTQLALCSCALLSATWLPSAAAGQPACDAQRPLTVTDGIESSRFLTGTGRALRTGSGDLLFRDGSAVFLSPHRSRYIVLLLKGDLASNTNKLTVVSGGLSDLASARRYRVVASLFTRSLGQPDGWGSDTLTYPGYNANAPVWLSEDRIALRWSAKDQTTQVFTIDLVSGAIHQLTRAPGGVSSFALSPSGSLVYSAHAPHDDALSRRMLATGFVVTNTDAYALLRGEVDGYSSLDRMYRSQLFTQRMGQRPRLLSHGMFATNSWPPQFIHLSPDSRLALVDTTPEIVLASWARFQDAGWIHSAIAEGLTKATDTFLVRQLKQLSVVDLRTATVRPLLQLPNTASLTAIWSPDGQKILFGPSFYDDGDEASTRGLVVAEIDVRTGQTTRLPVDKDFVSKGILELSYVDANTVQVVGSEGTLWFGRSGAYWHSIQAATVQMISPTISVEVRQDLNHPPALWARDTRSGESVEVLDPNPQFACVTLGEVSEIHWQSSLQGQWSGLLYRPVGYKPGARYPLVIQTHGYAPASQFSLYGKGPGAPGTGPGWSVFAAQALANRGIAVLQIETKTPGGILGTPEEAVIHIDAVDTAVDKLVADGLVDRNRIGLVGFSRTGWHVLSGLVRGKTNIAAALVSDSIDASYLQATLMPGYFAGENGARPFGDGLKTWFELAPGFQADNIKAPLRLQLESGGLPLTLSYWELFSRLRQLDRPVEYFVIPDVEHGSHGLQNPRQVFSAQQGAVDWFDFWLNGHEDPDPFKRVQYARWEKLCDQQRAEELKGRLFCIPSNVH